MIQGTAEIRRAYGDAHIVERYLEERFGHPLGALLHRRQARWLKRLLHAQRPQRVLEIAPGPARLTVEIAPAITCGATLLDASAAMLTEAKRRLAPVGVGRWNYLQGDVFQLPFRTQFDLVYVFRLLRHFEAPERARVYAEIGRVLRPGGVLVFDAVNEAVSARLRARQHPGEYRHYDALMRPETLRSELAAAGFQVESLVGVQHCYHVLHHLQVLLAPRAARLARTAMEIVDRLGPGEPLEWIVTCHRN